MGFNSLLDAITLFVSFLCISDVESMRTLTNVAAKRGGSITIPCFYDKRYKRNSKYLCRGYYWSSCNVLAFANSRGIISVTDHPEQNILIVEMNPVSDSGYYWCAAEIGSKWDPDDHDYLYLTVSEDPGLSVVKSRVSGAEGGSVTVQCLYSAAYRNTQKQWCRFRDGSCKTVGKTDTSQNSAVHISDDGRSFSVEIRGLKKSDAGWYWCSAGGLQVPVHISVTDPPPVTKALTKTGTTTTHHVDSYTSVLKHKSAARLPAASSSVKSISVLKHVSASPVTETSSSEKTSSSVIIESESQISWYLVALLLLLAILVIIIIFILIKKCKAKKDIRTKEGSNDITVHTSSKSKASKVNEEDVTYSSVHFASKKKTVSRNDVDDVEAIYSSVVC